MIAETLLRWATPRVADDFALQSRDSFSKGHLLLTERMATFLLSMFYSERVVAGVIVSWEYIGPGVQGNHATSGRANG